MLNAADRKHEVMRTLFLEMCVDIVTNKVTYNLTEDVIQWMAIIRFYLYVFLPNVSHSEMQILFIQVHNYHINDYM